MALNLTLSEIKEVCNLQTFIGLSVLQAILLHISSTEHMHGSLNGGYAKSSKQASGIAFIGICVTLMLGFVAFITTSVEVLEGIIFLPLVFVGGWAIYYKHSSKNIDAELLHEQATEYYIQLIERCIELDRPNNKAELLAFCQLRLKKELTWQGAVNIALTNLPVLREFTMLHSAVDGLALNESQFDILVEKLVKSGKRIYQRSDDNDQITAA